MRKIFVVDDDRSITDLLLQSIPVFLKNVKVFSENDGQHALQKIISVIPDIILLDIFLPDLDGFEICKQLKSIPETAKIPIILMTGFRSDKSLKVKGLEIGAEAFLNKPFEIPEMIAQVRAMLRLKEAEDNLRKERDVLKKIVKKQTDIIDKDEERWNLVLENTNDGIWDWNLLTSEFFLSRKWLETLGYKNSFENPSAEELLGLIHPDDQLRFTDTLKHYLSKEIDKFNIEIRMKCEHGGYKWLLYRGKAVWDSSGVAYRMVGTQADISEQKEMEKQLKKLALHDPLTGLPNRVLLSDRSKVAFEHAIRFNTLIGVLFLDLDGFKGVNDHFGHNIGDKILKTVSDRLLYCVRKGDTVARIGGDEFIMLLPELKFAEDASVISDRILLEIAKPYLIEEREISLSGSIGIAIFPQNGDTLDVLLKNADSAMYFAKEKGKNRYYYYSNLVKESGDEKPKAFESYLISSIRNRDFEVYYQPIIDLENGKICSFEALLRWNHPRLGVTYPNSFMHVAKKKGYAVDLGIMVFDNIINDLNKVITVKPKIEFHMNLSEIEFYSTQFLHHVQHIMAKNKKLRGKVFFEITENIISLNESKSFVMFQEFEHCGIGICLDNFGTGNFSLQYLAKYSISSIKIDRILIDQVHEDKKQQNFAKAMIKVAHTLGINVIASGIEKKEQTDALERLNYNFIQGYVCSEPVPIKNILKMLKEEYVFVIPKHKE